MAGDPRVQRTRRRVLAAAYELLTEVGFDGVTIELVSARSGVARSTLYRHWASKSEILRDAFAEVSGAAPDGPPTGMSGQDRLCAYAVALADGLSGLWGRAALTLAATSIDDPAQRAVMATFTDGMRRDLLALLQAAAGAGELPAGADPSALLDRVEELVVAPLFYRYAFRSSAADGDEARRIARAAWNAVTKPTTSSDRHS